jgi:hypothetical protein
MVIVVPAALLPAGSAAGAIRGPAATDGDLAKRPEIKLPPGAVRGSTPERRAAWNRLSAAQQKQKVEEFRRLVLPRLKEKAAALNRTQAAKPDGKAAPRAGSFAGGAQPTISRADNFTQVRPPAARTAPGGVTTQAVDADGDGLDQGFEAQVADAFTPFYHVSAGERAGTGFASFFNSVPQTVSGVFGPVPPLIYQRVQPRGIFDGVAYLRVDYLTLWNRDDGFQLPGLCGVPVGFIEDLLGIDIVIGGHTLDNERSAALVAAPAVGGTYNPDPAAYGALQYYTAAHEFDALGENSRYFPDGAFFNPPIPAGGHIELALALGKHSTYTFNPKFHPVIRPEIMAFAYSVIDDLFFSGVISEETYLIFLGLADEAFFDCIVEDFNDQGGQFATTRIDVGEPNQPINGSTWIQDTNSGILEKFTIPLW